MGPSGSLVPYHVAPEPSNYFSASHSPRSPSFCPLRLILYSHPDCSLWLFLISFLKSVQGISGISTLEKISILLGASWGLLGRAWGQEA